jgi:Ca2+/H+ antiporter, TMEM165/GDT1 family
VVDLVNAAIAAFGVIFVAELGDKTQLLALGFGARHSLRRVAIGLTLGYGAASLLAVAVGGVLGATFPQRQIEIVGGLVFIAFAILAFRRDDHDDEAGDGAESDERDHDATSGSGALRRSIARSSVIVSIGLTILIAEMGDKTQIATATLAARSNPIGTWVGATIGEVASGMVGALAGSMVGDRISSSVLSWASAVLFALFGISMLIGFP